MCSGSDGELSEWDSRCERELHGGECEYECGSGSVLYGSRDDGDELSCSKLYEHIDGGSVLFEFGNECDDVYGIDVSCVIDG